MAKKTLIGAELGDLVRCTNFSHGYAYEVRHSHDALGGVYERGGSLVALADTLAEAERAQRAVGGYIVRSRDGATRLGPEEGSRWVDADGEGIA